MVSSSRRSSLSNVSLGAVLAGLFLLAWTTAKRWSHETPRNAPEAEPNEEKAPLAAGVGVQEVAIDSTRLPQFRGRVSGAVSARDLVIADAERWTPVRLALHELRARCWHTGSASETTDAAFVYEVAYVIERQPDDPDHGTIAFVEVVPSHGSVDANPNLSLRCLTEFWLERSVPFPSRDSAEMLAVRTERRLSPENPKWKSRAHVEAMLEALSADLSAAAETLDVNDPQKADLYYKFRSQQQLVRFLGDKQKQLAADDVPKELQP